MKAENLRPNVPDLLDARSRDAEFILENICLISEIDVFLYYLLFFPFS